MNKHVQIRNLAGAEHRKLKQRAAAKGLTITEYVKRLIAEDLSRPARFAIRSAGCYTGPEDLPPDDHQAHRSG